jgi:hypothetical protein
MFDKASGRYYAMLLLSTLLGISERYHPVSCTALVYNARLGGYGADIDPSRLLTAPVHARAARRTAPTRPNSGVSINIGALPDSEAATKRPLGFVSL